MTPEALAATGIPVLFIVGTDDVLFPPDCVRAVQQRVPGSRLVEMPAAGHSAYFEDAAGFNAALRGFLVRLPTP